jgi:hypothetical protein
MSDDLDDLLNDVGFAVRVKPENGLRGGAPSWGSGSSTGTSAHGIPAHSRNQESKDSSESISSSSSSSRNSGGTSSRSSGGSGRPRGIAPPSSLVGGNNRDDLDDLLAELNLGEAAPVRSTTRKAPAVAICTRPTSIAGETEDEDDHVSGARITTLGGDGVRVGRTGSLSFKVASERVRCLHCDFIVERWSGQRWCAEADYMFFRNAAPSRERMAAKLEAKRGFAAYACQCSWVSVKDLVAIRLGDTVDGKTLKWVAA